MVVPAKFTKPVNFTLKECKLTMKFPAEYTKLI